MANIWRVDGVFSDMRIEKKQGQVFTSGRKFMASDQAQDWVVFLVATILLGSLSVHGKGLREYDILLM